MTGWRYGDGLVPRVGWRQRTECGKMQDGNICQLLFNDQSSIFQPRQLYHDIRIKGSELVFSDVLKLYCVYKKRDKKGILNASFLIQIDVWHKFLFVFAWTEVIT